MRTQCSPVRRATLSLLALGVLSVGAPSAAFALRPLLRSSFLGIETGRSPGGIATADLDGLGGPDLVVTNRGSNTLTLLRGTGDGRFDDRSTYPVGAEPRGVALADVTGDGRLDALVANYGSNSLTVLPGTVTGFALPGANYPCGPQPWGVVADDFDGDGRTDVAVANYASLGTVSILLGNDGGMLDAPVTYGTAQYPGPLTAADLDGDGDADLVAASYGYCWECLGIDPVGGTTVSVLLGNGNGTFAAGIDYTVAPQPVGVAVGDLDGDGRPEIVASSSRTNAASILHNQGDGTFAPASSLPVDPYSPSGTVALADLNGDHNLDLVVAVVNNHSWAVVFAGHGDGTFGPGQHSNTGGQPVSFVPGDFDGDGDTDLAAACSNNVVAVMRGNGDGSFGTALSDGGLFSPSDVACADFDADGRLDLVSTGGSGMYATGVILVQRGLGNGSFASPMSFGNAGTLPVSIALADFDGDGRIDVGTSDYGNGSPNTNSVFKNTGGGRFDTHYPLPGKSFGWSCVAGNLNGDGFPDLAVTTTLGEFVQIYAGSANGVASAATQVPCPGVNAMGMCLGDLNGDGRQDMVVSHWGPSNLTVLLANGDGTFTIDVIPIESSAFRVVCADFDADGRMDLAVLVFDYQGYVETDAILLFWGLGDGHFVRGEALGTGLGAWNLTVADANADGIPDLMTANSLANTVSLFLGHGDRSFPEREDYGVGDHPQALTIGDINADQRPDMLVANKWGNDISVMLNDTPVAVEISDLAAAWSEDGVRITWMAHTDNAATFRVLRAEAEAGPYETVSSDLPGSSGRQAHEFTDRTAPPGRDLYYKVAVDEDGRRFESASSSVSARGLITALASVAPNPARDAARIDYSLARAGRVRLDVFDLRGRKVRSLVAGRQPEGRRAITWDGLDDSGRPLPSGVYLVRLGASDQEWTRKLVLLRR